VRVMLMCSFSFPYGFLASRTSEILPRPSMIVCRFDIYGNPLMHAICIAGPHAVHNFRFMQYPAHEDRSGYRVS
jgi:hypothetical protein